MNLLAGALYGALLAGTLVLLLGTNPLTLAGIALVILGASVQCCPRRRVRWFR